MGPLASAAFVRTIYGMHRGRLEQESPVVLLYSNPKIGDRTKTFLGGGDHRPLLRDLETGISALLAQGADQVVICCVTMHYLLPLVSPELRARVVSLIDTVFEELERIDKRCLLACTTGAKKLGLFQNHPSWKSVRKRVCVLSEADQQQLHDAIYLVKRSHVTDPLTAVVHGLGAKYGVEAIIAGCTELHLLSPACAGATFLNEQFEIIDPLSAIAERTVERDYATAICA
jgi:aspartate racemase